MIQIIAFATHCDPLLVGSKWTVFGDTGIKMPYSSILNDRDGPAPQIDDRGSGKLTPRLRWTYAPLVALAVVSLWPIPFGFLFKGTEQDFVWLGTIMLAIDNWPFVPLTYVSIKKAKNEWPSVGSVRYAMWSSIVFMVLMNITVVLAVFGLLPASERETASSFLVLGSILQPILGMIGWSAGRGIYRLSEIDRSGAG